MDVVNKKTETPGKQTEEDNEDVVSEASEESFPASDPPSFDPGTTGAPAGHAKPQPDEEAAESESSDAEGEWMKTTADAVETEMARRQEMGVSEHPPAGMQPGPAPRKAGTSWTAVLVALIALVVVVWLLWLLVA